MRISGLTTADFQSIVETVSRDNYNGNVIMHPDSHDLSSRSCQARLRTVRSGEGPYDCAPGARRGHSGRRTVAACWHAYRDVLAELFERFPNARVSTGITDNQWPYQSTRGIRYNGREGFWATFPETAFFNVGSAVQPETMPDLCDC